MRILFITHRPPFPPDKGEKIRSYNILKYLSRDHDVYLASLADSNEEANRSVLPALIQPSLGLSIVVRNRFSTMIQTMFCVATGIPATVGYFYNRELQSAVDMALNSFNFDAVLCSSSQMAEFIFRSVLSNDEVRSTKPVLLMDMIDVDSAKWEQYAYESQIPLRWLYSNEARAMRRYEHRIRLRFDGVLLVSDEETKLLAPLTASCPVVAIGNGVDADYFCKQSSDLSNSIVFTGVMNYKPNVDACTWFALNVFPALRERFDELRFVIVGSSPTKAILELQRIPGIEVTGYVDDVRPYIQKASVCVVPLKIARGIQNKVLEAMALSKSIVATPQATSGLSAVDGTHLLVAQSAQEFIEATSRLLTEPSLATALGTAARNLVLDRFSWSAQLAKLDIYLAGRT